jgi:hypothetical protein
LSQFLPNDLPVSARLTLGRLQRFTLKMQADASKFCRPHYTVRKPIVKEKYPPGCGAEAAHLHPPVIRPSIQTDSAALACKIADRAAKGKRRVP